MAMTCPMHSAGYMGFGWLYQIIILLVFFMIIWWMVRGNNFGYKCKKNESALDILKRRLASGEITDKEFHKLKKDIQDGDR